MLAAERLRAGEPLARAVLVAVDGSAPLPLGATLFVDRDGTVEGSITGGCVESALAHEAAEVLAGGPPRLLTYGISDELAGTAGLTCGGTVHIFLHALLPGAASTAAVVAALDAVAIGRPAALATLLDGEAAGTVAAVVPAGDLSTLGSRPVGGTDRTSAGEGGGAAGGGALAPSAVVGGDADAAAAARPAAPSAPGTSAAPSAPASAAATGSRAPAPGSAPAHAGADAPGAAAAAPLSPDPAAPAPGMRVVGALGGGLLDRSVGRDAAGMLALGQSGVRSYGADGATLGAELRVHVRTFAPPPQMVLVGAVDFSAALAPLAQELGYAVTIGDPRAAFAKAPRFARSAEVVVGWPDALFAGRTLGPRDVVVVFSHDPRLDVPALEAALATGAGYVGALGSRRTTAERTERLRAAGVTEAQIARIHAPCGLDIGGGTPEETAISILAEIVAVRSARPAAPLRDTAGPIQRTA